MQYFGFEKQEVLVMFLNPNKNYTIEELKEAYDSYKRYKEAEADLEKLKEAGEW